MGMSVGALAADPLTSTAPSGQIDVTLNLQASYSVTIPDNITFNSITEEPTGHVTANDVVLEDSSKKLVVKIQSNGEWTLTNSTANAQYRISKDGSELKNQDEVLSVTGAKSGDTELTFKITNSDNATVAGRYTDTLTFTASIEDVD